LQEDDMEEQRRKGPGEAEGDGQARHGYRNEVSWEDGKGRQPYANQGEAEQGPGSAHEFEVGNAGETAGRNAEQVEQVRRMP
jgi:hypothetical protein